MTEKRKMDKMYATQADSSVSKKLFLYHGTNRTNVENINTNGFDRSYLRIERHGLRKGPTSHATWATLRMINFLQRTLLLVTSSCMSRAFLSAASVRAPRTCNIFQIRRAFDSAVDYVADPKYTRVFNIPLWIFVISAFRNTAQTNFPC